MLVLETDEPHPDTQEEKGSFGEILNELLAKAGEAHKPKLAIETAMQYIVKPEGGSIPNKEEITDDIHAIIITGSEWDAHGDDPWIHELMDLIRRTLSYLLEAKLHADQNDRSLDPPPRHSLYGHLLRSSNPMSNFRLESRTRSQWRMGALTLPRPSLRHRSRPL